MSGSRMILRVGHVLTAPAADGGLYVIAWEPPNEIVSDTGPGLAWSMRYPPCQCPDPDCPDRTGGSPTIGPDPARRKAQLDTLEESRCE